MAGTTVALSGVFNVQLPSIRSLNLHLDLEGRRHNYAPYAPRIPSQEPAVVLHDINQYPLYPLHGDRRFPDPSQNAFADSGFHSSGVSFIPQISDGYSATPRDLTSDPEVWKVRRPISVRYSPYKFSYVRRMLGLYEEPPNTVQPRPHSQDPGPSGPSARETKLNPIPAAATNTNTNPPAPKRAPQVTTVSFADVAAHTAKCDECNRRNKDGMSRCLSCGWQCCRKCLTERRGDCSHRYLGGMHVPAAEKERNAPVQSRTNVSARDSSGSRSTLAPRRTQNENRGLVSGDRQETIPAHQQQRGHRELSHDSEETLSCALSQSGHEDVTECAGGVRRNPLRSARPSSLATDDSE